APDRGVRSDPERTDDVRDQPAGARRVAASGRHPASIFGAGLPGAARGPRHPDARRVAAAGAAARALPRRRIPVGSVRADRVLADADHLPRHDDPGALALETLAALNDVTLEVPAGQFVGVIGANGSGKSTLLKIMAGLLVPDGGDVQVNGTLSPLLELGLGFNNELTVHENVALYGAVL